MNLFNWLFKPKPAKQPEDFYNVTITDQFIRVEHPKRKTEEIAWTDITEIRLINTNQGPELPDVWLALLGESNGCLIPQGAEGFETVYDIVSGYESFNYENFITSMRCTDNAQFELWKKQPDN